MRDQPVPAPKSTAPSMWTAGLVFSAVGFDGDGDCSRGAKSAVKYAVCADLVVSTARTTTLSPVLSASLSPEPQPAAATTSTTLTSVTKSRVDLLCACPDPAIASILPDQPSVE